MDPAGSKLEFVATFEKTRCGEFKEFDARFASTLTSPPEPPRRHRQGHERRHERRGREQGNRAARLFTTRLSAGEFHSDELRRIESNRYVARASCC